VQFFVLAKINTSEIELLQPQVRSPSSNSSSNLDLKFNISIEQQDEAFSVGDHGSVREIPASIVDTRLGQLFEPPKCLRAAKLLVDYSNNIILT
jgi:hypothetical protein